MPLDHVEVVGRGDEFLTMTVITRHGGSMKVQAVRNSLGCNVSGLGMTLIIHTHKIIHGTEWRWILSGDIKTLGLFSTNIFESLGKWQNLCSKVLVETLNKHKGLVEMVCKCNGDGGS